MNECDKLVDLTDRLAFVTGVDLWFLDVLKRECASHAQPLSLLRQRMREAAERLAESLSFGESEASPQELVDKAFESFHQKKHAGIQRHKWEFDEVICSLRAGNAAQAVIAKAQGRS